MSLFRIILFSAMAVFALLLGAIFALPAVKKQAVGVEIGGVRILAEVAADSYSRGKGLSQRSGLNELGGMLFVFERPDYHAIWMKDMKFPLDVFWIKNGSVADMEENVPAPLPGAGNAFLKIYKPDVPADFILETKAGFAAKHNLKIGDKAMIFWKGEENWQKYSLKSDVLPSPDAEANKAPPAGYDYFIETALKKPPAGSDLKILKSVAKNSAYEKFEISYKSGDLLISGIMNVPAGPVPAGGFPVIILNHGLIRPEIYFSGRGSKREQDFFSRRGYVTVHPDYRGYGSSDSGSSPHHDFYAGYTDDVLNLVAALREADFYFVDAQRMGMWGHSMGGGIAARAAVLSSGIKAFVLFAPISADAEDNFYELPPEELDWLAETYGFGGEAGKIYDKISPLSYFDNVEAPMQLHHGMSDKDVPLEFSEKMFAVLRRYGKKVEFFKYPGEKHEFGEAWDLAAERALQFFNKYVKNAR